MTTDKQTDMVDYAADIKACAAAGYFIVAFDGRPDSKDGRSKKALNLSGGGAMKNPAPQDDAEIECIIRWTTGMIDEGIGGYGVIPRPGTPRIHLDFDKGVSLPDASWQNLITHWRHKYDVDGNEFTSRHSFIRITNMEPGPETAAWIEKMCDTYNHKIHPNIEVFSRGHYVIREGWAYADFKEKDGRQHMTPWYRMGQYAATGFCEMTRAEFEGKMETALRNAAPRPKKGGGKKKKSAKAAKAAKPPWEGAARVPGGQGQRHNTLVDWVSFAVRQAGGQTTPEELYEKMLAIIDENGMPNTYKPGSPDEAELRELCKDFVRDYKAEEDGGSVAETDDDDPKEYQRRLHEIADTAIEDYQILSPPLNTWRSLMWWRGNRWIPAGEGAIKQNLLADFSEDVLMPGELRKIIELIGYKARRSNRDATGESTDDIFDKKYWIFSFKNGQWNARTGEFTETADRDVLNTIRFNFDYDPEAECPKFMEMIRNSTKPASGNPDTLQKRHDRKLGWVRDMFTLTVIPKRIKQRAFILYGPGRGGKGVTLKILQALTGGKFHTCTLREMSAQNDKHWAEPVVGKLLVCGGDGTNWSLKDVSNFKMLAGNDHILVRPLNMRGYHYDAICTLVFLHNELPLPEERSIGFVRKVQLVIYEQMFADDDGLADEITGDETEMAGIFNWIAPRIRELVRRKGRLADPATVPETRREWQLKNMDIDDFCKEFVKLKEGAMTPVDAILTEYRELYEAGVPERNQIQKNQFVRKFREIMNESDGNVRVPPTERRRIDGEQMQMFLNVQYRAEAAAEAAEPEAAAAVEDVGLLDAHRDVDKKPAESGAAAATVEDGGKDTKADKRAKAQPLRDGDGAPGLGACGGGNDKSHD